MLLLFLILPILAFADDSLEKLLINKNILVPAGYNYSMSSPYEQYQVFEKGIIQKIDKDIALVRVKKTNKKVRIDDIRLDLEAIKGQDIAPNELVFIKIGDKYLEGTSVVENGKLTGRIHEFYGLDNQIPRTGYPPETMMANISINDSLRGNCTEKNLIRESRWSIEPGKLPQYDQGPDGICYAFVGMQLIDFFNLYHRGNKDFFNINRPFLGNAIFLGLKSREFDPENVRNTLALGYVKDIISAAEKYGYCHDDVLEKSISKFLKAEDLKLNSQEFYFLTLYFMDSFKTSVKEISEKSGKSTHYLTEKIINNMKNYEARKMIDKIWAGHSKSQYADFSRINIDKIDKEKIEKHFAKYFINENYVGFLEKVFEDCNKPGNFTKLKLGKLIHTELNETLSDEDVMNIISSELGKKNATGIAIGFCSGVLSEGLSYGGIPTKNRSDPGDCGNHASILIGQRMRGGKCQYLLRNTAGFSGCDSGFKYSSEWECQFDGPGKESGVWVDAKSLASAIYKLDYFFSPASPEEKSNLKGQHLKFKNMMKSLKK